MQQFLDKRGAPAGCSFMMLATYAQKNNKAHCGSLGYRNAGFTLIELMVVVLLIGIISTYAVLSVSRDPWEKELEQQLQRLTLLVSAGSEQAVLRSAEFAILFNDSGYSFQIYNQKKWQPILDDQLFRERNLPDGLRLTLKMEDLDFQIGEDENEQPRVLMLSSGEVTPFSVTMTVEETGNKKVRSWDIFGDLETESENEKR